MVGEMSGNLEEDMGVDVLILHFVHLWMYIKNEKEKNILKMESISVFFILQMN